MRSMSQVKTRSLLWIFSSIVIALMLNILPVPAWLQGFFPEWVALIMIYWLLTEPQKVGLGSAWFVGLLMDVLMGSVLGEHAFALTILAALVCKLQPRLRFAPLWQQSVSVFLLVFIYSMLILILQGMLGSMVLRQWFWVPAVSSMLFWPCLFLLFEGQQRQSYRYP